MVFLRDAEEDLVKRHVAAINTAANSNSSRQSNSGDSPVGRHFQSLEFLALSSPFTSDKGL